MSILSDVFEELLKLLPQKFELTARYDKAVICIGPNDSVSPDDRAAWCWVRVHGEESSLVPALNRSTAMIPGLQVKVTKTKEGFYKVVDLAHEVPAFDDDDNPYLPEHAASHEWRPVPNRGQDLVDIFKRAWVELRAEGTNPATMQLYVQPWKYRYRGQPMVWPGGLSPELQIPESGRWWATLYLRAETAELGVEYGYTAHGVMMPPKSTLGYGEVSIADILIEFTTTEITEDDIEDARELINIIGTPTPPAPPFPMGQEVAIGLPILP